MLVKANTPKLVQFLRQRYILNTLYEMGSAAGLHTQTVAADEKHENVTFFPLSVQRVSSYFVVKLKISPIEYVWEKYRMWSTKRNETNCSAVTDTHHTVLRL